MSNQLQNPFVTLSPGQAASGSGGGDASRRGVSSPRRELPINRFTALGFIGTARQLFGIQFVNVMLILLTIGIRTPWARVRKRRFFFNNTRILGNGLDYLATGFDLFKGWSIVVIVMAGFYSLPILGVLFLQEGTSLALLAIYPWAINRSLRFNARNIVWRDVRFDFSGSYPGSAWYLFLLPFIGITALAFCYRWHQRGCGNTWPATTDSVRRDSLAGDNLASIMVLGPKRCCWP